jgi:archaellum biogenesis protein FlaJ (TadC family)
MSEEIIFEESKEELNLKKTLKELKLDIKLICKLPVLIYSIILFAITYDVFLLALGIVFFLFINFATKYLVISLMKKTNIKKINYNEIGRYYYTEIGLTPREYYNLIYDILFSSILSLFFNLVLFAVYFQVLKDNILNLFLLIAILFVPFILLLYVLIYPLLKESSYYFDLNKEIPVASMIITAFSAANIHPYIALSTLGKLKIFKGFKKVFLQIEKLRICLALSPIESINLFSKMLKNEQLKKLLQTISAISLGSSIYNMLKEQMKENFKIFEKKIEEFIDRFNILLAAQLIVFILIPIASMMTLIFMQGNTLSFLLFSLFLAPLIFFFLFLLMIQGYALPFLRIGMDYNPKSLYSFAIIPLSILLFSIGFISFSLAFFLSISISMLGFYFLNKENAKNKEKLLNELPSIVKDIAEEVKKGNGLYQAIDKIAERYEQAGGLLKKISFMNKLGISVEEILENEKLPIFFKQVFVALEECNKVGLDPSTMEEFSDFVNRLDAIRKIFKLKTRFFRYSSLLITALLGFSLAISLNVIGNLISTFKMIAESSGMIGSFSIINIQVPLEIIKELVYSSGFLNATLLGFLGGYADGNVIEGIKVALLTSSICFISLYLIGGLGIFKFS